ncbi:hypothetical protein Thiosp_01333 [Thiorhodovibrio litoralis]|nr:hypothetical protein Thiosp_01333 [Thiorhodovibrio litoralis]
MEPIQPLMVLHAWKAVLSHLQVVLINCAILTLHGLINSRGEFLQSALINSSCTRCFQLRFSLFYSAVTGQNFKVTLPKVEFLRVCSYGSFKKLQSNLSLADAIGEEGKIVIGLSVIGFDTEYCMINP